MIFPIGIFLIHITLLFSNLLAGDAISPECVAELAAEFVACLPVIAAPPNNFSVAFSPKSSDVTTFVFTPTGTGSYCLDPLVHHAPILGFPLSVSRINLLPSVCLGNTKCSLETTTVECSGELVSELEQAIRECNRVIIGSCMNKQEQCCWGLCEKQPPPKKTVVGVPNGPLLCYRHGIYQEKPVEFTGKSATKLKEDIRKCGRLIKAGRCTDQQCCRHLCKEQLPYVKTMKVSYEVINGADMCLCQPIYQGKPGPCAIMPKF